MLKKITNHTDKEIEQKNWPKVVALVIARMTSTRLPGKGLKDICGRPLLGHIVDRLRAVKCIDKIVLTTTNHDEDRPLIVFAQQEGIDFFAYAGDPEDVVGRIRAAGEAFGADVLVQVSGDSPLVHPPTIEKLIESLFESKISWSTVAPRDGKSAIHEGMCAFTMEGWRKVDENSTEPHQRENLCACLWECPNILQKIEVMDAPIFYTLKHRISVDTQADLEFMREIHQRLYKSGEIVDLAEVIRLLQNEPELLELNSCVRQKGLHDRSKRLVFRVDAGQETGMGHLVRCLALASFLQERYFCGIAFVTKNSGDKAHKIIEEKGFVVKSLSSDASLNDELLCLEKFAREYQANGIILDLTEKITTAQYVKKLKELNLPVICIDNNSEGSHLADVAIITGLHQKPGEEWKHYQGKLFYGGDYLILRKELTKQYPESPNTIPHILIAMGGSDPQNLTMLVLSHLIPLFADLKISVMVGPFYPYNNELTTFLSNYPEVSLYFDLENPAWLFSQANIAITSFGVTTYELASFGVPAIVINPTRYHHQVAENVMEYGFYINAGYYKEVSGELIRNSVEYLLKEKEAGAEMSKKGRQLFDGKGLERVAKIIMDEI